MTRPTVPAAVLLLAAALAAVAAAWQPAADSMLTDWGARLTPQSAWPEYPRPALARDHWTNLNGLWNYAVTAQSAAAPPAAWQGEILVPFAIESALSGVKRRITPAEAIWYRRTFTAPAETGRRTLLHFEAVDYQSTVWVNGTEVGSHTGGYLPFSFDITAALKPGDNTLVVKATDATDTAWQLHGKQVTEPGGIWYTPVSGIWQTVWLEQVPKLSIAALKITPQTDGTVRIVITPGGAVDQAREASVRVSLAGEPVTAATGPHDALTVKIPAPRLWSPDSPTLYDLAITLGDDTVKSCVGLRETSVAKAPDGHLRFHLNGRPLFHFGTLDQGWWPDGLLTPPSDAAMRSDIEFLKAAGFNTIRKHIKVEPRRYYHHCDRIGILVWQDQVSSGTGKNRGQHAVSPPWTRLQPDPADAAWPDAAHAQFMAELQTMIDTLHNHPSIVQWVTFNEAWGQHRSLEVGKWAAAHDPTRQVNIASGGNFWPAGHVVDHHQYPHPGFPFRQGANGRFDGFVKVVGEFGGHGFPVPGHLWNPNANNWGYGGLPKDKEEWIARYQASIAALADLKRRGIAAGIYTQTTDVEPEINGLITYDRKVQKLPPATLARIHREAGLLDGPAPAAAKTPAIPNVAAAPVAPAMPRAEIEAGLKSRDRALFIKGGWIRDPYITLGPDDCYYLTGTTPPPKDPREQSDPYNVGLGPRSIVGAAVQLWRSRDLIDWESLGAPFTLKDGPYPRPGDRIWAPELHWVPQLKRWALVHCPQQKSNLALSAGPEPAGPWSFPMGRRFAGHHDPSLFCDGDTWWVLSENTHVQPLAPGFTGFTSPRTRIDPAGSRPGPDGTPISRIGHEGATMRRIGARYVHFGTAWSTDRGRKGSYNLYYSTADKVAGPYGPRRFAGRFLGHGTPFQTRDGNWWCTAFFNANVPPLPREGIETRDLSTDAQTINHRGTTIVPLDVRTLADGDVRIRALDPAYATPGPDEAQKFTD